MRYTIKHYSLGELFQLFRQTVGNRIDDVFVREFKNWLKKTIKQPPKFKTKSELNQWLKTKMRQFFNQQLGL